MKDLEWLREEVESLRKLGRCDSVIKGINIAVANTLYLIDQVEQSGVLSQEWIDDHKVSRISNLRKMTMSDVVPAEQLENLVVPKSGQLTPSNSTGLELLSKKWIKENEQQVHEPNNAWWVESEDLKALLALEQTALPEVPEFVAEFINESKNRSKGLYGSMRYIVKYGWDDKKHRDYKVFAWLGSGNEINFARAWLDGYTVEEKKYVVKNNGGSCILLKEDGIIHETVCVPSTGKEIYELTEKEIRGFDPRYLPFKVPVEEVED